MKKKRTAFYGGSFDPVHRAHLAIAHTLLTQFELDEFVFIPAFHAPHKVRLKPTSAYDRFAMLCLATQKDEELTLSRIEIETPDRPFTVETLARINEERPDEEIFFVMGADSWRDIKTWREWEKVLTMSNHIVITRPGVELGLEHVTDDIRSRVVDLRIGEIAESEQKHIYIADSVYMDISGTELRRKIRTRDDFWRSDVTPEVANYIEKYQIYR